MEYIPNPSGTTRIYGPGSAFKIRYEFVDTSLGGAPLEPYAGLAGGLGGGAGAMGGNAMGGGGDGGFKTMPEPAALLQFQSKSCDRVYR